MVNVAIFWNTSSCNLYVNRRFREMYHFHIQGRKSAEQETRVQQVARRNHKSYKKLHWLCKIWGFHGGDYEECRLLGYYAVYLLYEPAFRRNASTPTSWWQEVTRFLSPWWWRRYFLSKNLFIQEPHDVTSEKTVFLYWWRSCAT
jgi:hypothetical protein